MERFDFNQPEQGELFLFPFDAKEDPLKLCVVAKIYGDDNPTRFRCTLLPDRPADERFVVELTKVKKFWDLPVPLVKDLIRKDREWMSKFMCERASPERPPLTVDDDENIAKFATLTGFEHDQILYESGGAKISVVASEHDRVRQESNTAMMATANAVSQLPRRKQVAERVSNDEMEYDEYA